MLKILVVEDNRTNQLLDSRVLANLGYTAEIVSSGADALDAYSNATFDAILMDVQMPGIDGYQTTAKIREREHRIGGPHTPIIGLSARAINGDREAALSAGMDDYLTKPMNIDQLRAALVRWLPHHGDGDGDTDGVSAEVHQLDPGAAPNEA